jgi:hypothetical protein
MWIEIVKLMILPLSTKYNWLWQWGYNCLFFVFYTIKELIYSLRQKKKCFGGQGRAGAFFTLLFWKHSKITTLPLNSNCLELGSMLFFVIIESDEGKFSVLAYIKYYLMLKGELRVYITQARVETSALFGWCI